MAGSEKKKKSSKRETDGAESSPASPASHATAAAAAMMLSTPGSEKKTPKKSKKEKKSKSEKGEKSEKRKRKEKDLAAYGNDSPKKRKTAEGEAEPGASAGAADMDTEPTSALDLLPKVVADRLRARGIADLFPIQKESYGPAKNGFDVVAQARTG